MIGNFEESELQTNQPASAFTDDKAATRSRLWSAMGNPRIVRVPRSFGGKDRHSKVSTVRGLRDRRVRLSVPTAIQVYSLQDKLGFNQPSKVVDWLINASQHAINKLPPLQFPPTNFIQFPQYEVEVPSPQPTSSRLVNNTIHSKGEEVGLVTGPTHSSLQVLPVYNQWKNSDVHYDQQATMPLQVGLSYPIFASEVSSQMNVDAKHYSQVHMPSLVSENLVSNAWQHNNESYSN